MNKPQPPRLWRACLWVFALAASLTFGLQAGRLVMWSLSAAHLLPW